jgi:hypothetical protein
MNDEWSHPALRPQALQQAVAQLELRRARRRGEGPPPTRTRGHNTAKDFRVKSLRAAFRRADQERVELARLRASGEPWPCLKFVGAFGYGETEGDPPARAYSDEITESAAG